MANEAFVGGVFCLSWEIIMTIESVKEVNNSTSVDGMRDGGIGI